MVSALSEIFAGEFRDVFQNLVVELLVDEMAGQTETR
jgi:hypothetical protein